MHRYEYECRGLVIPYTSSMDAKNGKTYLHADSANWLRQATDQALQLDNEASNDPAQWTALNRFRNMSRFVLQ